MKDLRFALLGVPRRLPGGSDFPGLRIFPSHSTGAFLPFLSLVSHLQEFVLFYPLVSSLRSGPFVNLTFDSLLIDWPPTGSSVDRLSGGELVPSHSLS